MYDIFMGFSVIFPYFRCPEKGTIPEGYAHLRSILPEDEDRIQCPKFVVKQRVNTTGNVKIQ
jgi:hypothetical protein